MPKATPKTPKILKTTKLTGRSVIAPSYDQWAETLTKKVPHDEPHEPDKGVGHEGR